MARRSQGSQQGQISLLMMVNLIPMMMLLAFVINIGMLVHAKINLQNAADGAAFAGAASQARLMTRISHISYQMRMNYKKFLFKYYVIGNMGLMCFPGRNDPLGRDAGCQQGDGENFRFINAGSRGNDEFPTVPSVCMYLQQTGNTCQMAYQDSVRLAADTADIPCPPGDAACSALVSSLRQIQAIQRMDCNSRARVNMSVALAFLYSTDPTGAIQSIDRVRGVVSDIGLIPANLLLYSRAKTLEEYVNARAQANVDVNRVSALEQEPELAASERTILAWRSARGALSGGTDGEQSWGTFIPESLRLNELLPEAASGSTELFNIQAQRMPAFSIFYTYSGPNPAGDGNGTNDCAPGLGEIGVPEGILPVWLYKSNDKRVYYAVKLTAQAKLLFNPFGNELTLTAYSAAAPFGSRIGPKLEDPSSLVVRRTIPREYVGTEYRPSYNIPTLHFSDSAMYHNVGVLRSFYNALTRDATTRASLTDIATNNITEVWEAAMAPDPWEIGRFNIPVHVSSGGGTNIDGSASAAGFLKYANNGFNQYFDSNGYYHSWAPLVPVDPARRNNRSPMDEIRTAIQTYTGTWDTSATGEFKVQLLNQLMDNLARYLDRMSSGRTPASSEDTPNIVTLVDPLRRIATASRIGSGRNMKVVDPMAIATSWSPRHPSADMAREGYSVKFVPMSSIFQNSSGMRLANSDGATSAGEHVGSWQPIPTSYFDQTTSSDLTKVPH